MSHQHYCYVGGHYWECQGKALRDPDEEPSVCICLPCGRPLEGRDHTGCDDPIELLPCAEHIGADRPFSGAHPAKPCPERPKMRDEDGKPVYAFCLWCGKTFSCWAEVEAHNRDNMKACAVHTELTQRPGGYPFMPPLLQDILQRATVINGLDPEKGYGPN